MAPAPGLTLAEAVAETADLLAKTLQVLGIDNELAVIALLHAAGQVGRAYVAADENPAEAAQRLIRGAHQVQRHWIEATVPVPIGAALPTVPSVSIH